MPKNKSLNKSLDVSVLITGDKIDKKIYLIRGLKVMVDKDLAELYGVPTKRLKQQVNRNRNHFPPDFMLELTAEEADSLRLQNATLKNSAQDNVLPRGRHSKYLPYVFTEQGVAMLSTVLNSERAIQVNIQIMRAFTKLREFMLSHRDLARKIEKLEKKFSDHDKRITVIFDAIRQLLSKEEEPKTKKIPIGFAPHK